MSHYQTTWVVVDKLNHQYCTCKVKPEITSTLYFLENSVSCKSGKDVHVTDHIVEKVD